MKKSFSLLFVFLNLIFLSFSQSDLINYPHENCFNLIQNDQNQYVFVGSVYDNDDFVNSVGKCTRIDSYGSIVNEFTYSIEGGKVSFSNIHFINETYYIFGSLSKNNTNNLLEITLNNNFEINDVKTFPIQQNKKIGYFTSIFDSDSNFVLTGYTSPNFCMFFYKISIDGDSIHSKFLNNPLQFAYQIHESSDSTKYHLFLDGYRQSYSFGGILQLDKNFDTLDFHIISSLIHKVYSSLKINDSTYFVSGIKSLDGNKLYLHKTNINGQTFESDTFFKVLGYNEYPAVAPGIVKYNQNIYIGSSSNVDYSNPHFSSLNSWFHLIKVDIDLNVQWEKWYGGDAYYSLNSILATADGGCLMVGTKYSQILTNQSILRHFIKVDANGNVQWTQDIETNNISFNLYPNPTSTLFTIENRDLSIKKVELFDLTGKRVLIMEHCENDNIQVNLEPYPNGIYFAKISTTKGITTQKVVKQ